MDISHPFPAQVAREIDFTQFPKINGGRMRKGKAMMDLETALNEKIPNLMEFLPRGPRADAAHAANAEPVAQPDEDRAASPEAVVLEATASK